MVTHCSKSSGEDANSSNRRGLSRFRAILDTVTLFPSFAVLLTEGGKCYGSVGWAKAAEALRCCSAMTRRAHGHRLRACGRGHGGSSPFHDRSSPAAFAHPTLRSDSKRPGTAVNGAIVLRSRPFLGLGEATTWAQSLLTMAQSKSQIQKFPGCHVWGCDGDCVEENGRRGCSGVRQPAGRLRRTSRDDHG